jgi:hypothetical protein
VQDHQVGRRHRSRVLGEIVDAPVEPPLDPGLFGEPACLLFVGGGELQVLGPGRARLQQLDVELADAPPISSTLAPSMLRSCRNWTIVWAVGSSPRLRYLLASLWANRWLKKR